MNELAGVSLTNADDAAGGSTVRHTLTTANGAGIILEAGTQRAHLHHNTVTGNTGQGLHVLASGDNTIEDNAFGGSSDAGVELVGSVRQPAPAQHHHPGRRQRGHRLRGLPPDRHRGQHPHRQ